MPHCEIRYSSNIETNCDIQDLCLLLADTLRGLPLFPSGGIRVRAIRCDHYVIADGHADNVFVDIQVRIGAGRTEAQKREAGEALMESAKVFCERSVPAGHMALSLDIQEINPALSWKHNAIHQRLAALD